MKVMWAAAVVASLVLVAAGAAINYKIESEIGLVVVPPTEQVKQTGEEAVSDDPLFLTPLIKAKKFQEALTRSKVNLKVEGGVVAAYSGFISVGPATCGSNLFFLFFPSQKTPASDPVIMWLQGGPGSSSMFGAFVEHGPVSVAADLSLKRRNNSWAAEHSVLYVDNPVGTGFSFSKGGCYAKNQDDVADNMFDFLTQFFQLFSSYSHLPFYVTGESYGGKYVPAVGYKLVQEKFPLAGIAVGNGLTDPENMMHLYGDVQFSFGLLDINERNHFNSETGELVAAIKKKDFSTAFDIFDMLLNGDFTNTTFFKNSTGCSFYFNVLLCRHGPIEFSYYPKYLNQPAVKKMFHAGSLPFNDSSKVVESHLKLDVMDTARERLAGILNATVPVLYYSGNLDLIVPTATTENFLHHLDWTRKADWVKAPRSFWSLPGVDDTAGFVKSAGNLGLVTIRNAGHMSPVDQPAAVLHMLNSFIKGGGNLSL